MTKSIVTLCYVLYSFYIYLCSMKVIIDLAHDIFGPTIKFLNSECTTALMTDVGYSVAMANRVLPGIQEVTSFVMMYSALLDRGFSRDEFEKKIINREPDGKISS